MVPGGFDDGEFDVTQEFIVVGDERQIDCDTLLHGGVGKALGDPLAVGLVGDLFADGGQVILAIGILDMGQEFGAFVRQMHATLEQVTGGTHLGGIDISLREHTTTQQRRNLLRVDLVVFGLATMDSLHIEGMAEDKRDAFIGTQVSELVPGEHALDRHDETLPIRGNGFQEGIRVGFHIAMHQNLAALVENADVHAAGMQVDAAVKWVLSSIKSH
jgi:hypothetical protein